MKKLEDIIYSCRLDSHNGLDTIIISEATLERAIIDWLKKQKISRKFKNKLDKDYLNG